MCNSSHSLSDMWCSLGKVSEYKGSVSNTIRMNPKFEFFISKEQTLVDAASTHFIKAVFISKHMHLY